MIQSPVLAADADVRKGQDVADLVACTRLGDAAAFAEIYRLHVNQVYSYAVRRLASREAAEEATQEIFTRALEGIARCRNDDAFSGWLFAIANHVVSNHFKSTQRPTEPINLVSEPVDTSPTPEERALSQDARDELRNARAHCLSTQERALFDLVLAELTDKQIAIATGRRAGAIRTARWRLLLKLRGCLKSLAHLAGINHAPA
jgi:RNA polymerase sigma-70 factor (ECF subfamily)